MICQQRFCRFWLLHLIIEFSFGAGDEAQHIY
jgi:hypothetical protein